MSIQIDSSNYEAFYLDYLEGNLSGNALAAFEQFIAAHPELMLDDDLLVTLPVSGETFDPVEKLALKKVIDLADLTTETVSYFLIAREENLLSPQQQAQLENWLAANALYRNDAALFAVVKMQPDTTQVFEAKNSLKRKETRVVPLWWTGVAAAAAGVALIITLSLPDDNQPGGTTQTASTDSIPSRNSIHTPKSQKDRRNQKQNNAKQQNENPGKSTEKSGSPVKEQAPAVSVPLNYPNAHAASGSIAFVNPLPKRGTEKPYNNPTDLQPAIAHYQPVNSSVIIPAPVNTDLAWTPIEQMQNPVEPVTKKLASTFNTPVDFRTAKATKKRSGGFYLRIGKFEISHQSASL